MTARGAQSSPACWPTALVASCHVSQLIAPPTSPAAPRTRLPRHDLMNAIALNSATLNLTRVLGPALGGVLIATIGVAGVFYLNAASFLAVLYALAVMRFPEFVPRAHRGVLVDLTGGLRYLA